jgi:hypothetical protein
MKKLVPDPPLPTNHPHRDPELDRANANLLAALHGTRHRSFGLRDGQGHSLFAVQPQVNAEDALLDGARPGP